MTNTYRLSWGVKESLVKYVESIEDGTIEAVSPARRHADKFEFEYDAEASRFDAETSSGVLQFLGTVRMSAYFGNMSISLADPRLELNAGKGQLLFRQLGLFSNEPFYAFASVDSATPTDENASFTFTVSLGPQGRNVLGEQYAVGQEIDPINIFTD